METIAQHLGVSETFMWHVFSLARSGKGYTSFLIPKRSGGNRQIHKPVDTLCFAQRLIKERILDNAPSLPRCVTAFREGLSICDNALVHCNKAVLVKFDLKDFFSSISFTRVIRIFESMGYYGSVAKGLAYLTTIPHESIQDSTRSRLHFEKVRLKDIASEFVGHLRAEAGSKRRAAEEGIDFSDLKWEARMLHEYADSVSKKLSRRPLKRRGLPQGAPTSPQLSNFAGKRLDARLSGLAATLNFDYTRYADDLTFSSKDPRAKTNVLERLVEQIVAECGFAINPTKTAFMRAPSSLMTTGLLVDGDRPRVRRQVIRSVRAMIHQQRLGSLDKEQSERLTGYLSFIRMVNPQQADNLQARLAN